MRERVGLPDLDPTVHVITRWKMEGLLAPQIKIGRVLLAGDAAHRHPPTGGLGLNSAGENRRNALQLWEPGPQGDARRRGAAQVIASQSMEFKEHNVEFGFRAQSDAVVPDGSPEPRNVDDIRVYVPDTRPGSPLPHAWVERQGRRMPLRDVAPTGSFFLVAGEDGEAWCEAARAAAAS